MQTVVLCGVGGYGQVYARELLGNTQGGVRWAGAVDPFPERIPNRQEIDAVGVPWFGSLEEFYRNNTADLCVIASPIAFHAAQSVFALQNGSNVLCEKPVAALPSEAAAMTAARDKAGNFLGIGFQWSYSAAILKLKQDISSGLYGKPLRLRTRVMWPRNREYYGRGSGWAGCVKDSAGRWFLDSVANNATAHYLHNMLYILGAPARSALPDTLSAVLMRANPIQMYDTAFLRMEWGGAVISFVATHAGEEHGGVVSRFEFENGVVTFDDSAAADARFTGELKDGTTVDYGNPNDEPASPLWKVLASLRGENDAGFSCPVEAAIPHNRAMIAALLSAEIGTFPEIIDNGERCFVPGLDAICRAYYDDLCFPGADWAKPGKTVRLDDPQIELYGK
ncbi:MAG: Gfo/Idh/MocA family oxidoreductase [Treponema sp.]|jgi:predicted dehydrogenase|nr:Gfo/Idh/MocA family oxidoreductase [Treponema sp.]